MENIVYWIKCFAEFTLHYYTTPKPSISLENDSQPVEPGDEHIETNHSNCNLPDNVPLMSSKEKLKCRKVKTTLQCHQPNPNKDTEKYARYLLFYFYPFRAEQDLRSHSCSQSYCEKFQKSQIFQIATRNKAFMEPYGDLVHQALLNLHNNLRVYDSEANNILDQVNDIFLEEDPTEGAIILADGPTALPSHVSPTLTSDTELHEIIRKLNKRKNAFYKIHGWAKDYIKNVSLGSPKTYIEPLHILLWVMGAAESHFL